MLFIWAFSMIGLAIMVHEHESGHIVRAALALVRNDPRRFRLAWNWSVARG
jgi:hypothetical protein